MAGSYRHITDSENNFCGLESIDNLGDAVEALEECYYMILQLADGKKEKIHEAWLHGYALKFLPESNQDLFTYDRFWE